MSWLTFWKKSASEDTAEQERREALAIHQQTMHNKQKYEELYAQQKQLADLFREERRRNHFGELFQTAVPLRRPPSN